MRFHDHNPQGGRGPTRSGGGPDEGAERSGRHHRHHGVGEGRHGHGGHGGHGGPRGFGGRSGRRGPGENPGGFGRGGEFGFGRGDFGFGRGDFGPGGPGGPGGPFGGHGGPGHHGRGRRRRGDVRIALLMLLAEEPRNGYGLMQTIEERSGGRWRPSPGSVYPALAQLEDEGLVRAVEQDGGRVFELTDAGREHLAVSHAEGTPPWEHGASDPRARAFGSLRQLIGGLARAYAQVVQVGDEDQRARAVRILEDARRALYGILAEAPADAPGEAPEQDDESDA